MHVLLVHFFMTCFGMLYFIKVRAGNFLFAVSVPVFVHFTCSGCACVGAGGLLGFYV